MRVVLDTNVLMSGLFWRGKPAQVLEAWRDGRFELVISPEVYAEYERVGEELRSAKPGVDPSPFLQLVARPTISPSRMPEW